MKKFLLMCHIAEHASARDIHNGSWFISCLTKLSQQSLPEKAFREDIETSDRRYEEEDCYRYINWSIYFCCTGNREACFYKVFVF